MFATTIMKKHFSFLNNLPKDLIIYIWKIIHYEHLKNLNNEFINTYKIGITAIMENSDPSKRKKRRFVYVNIDSKTQENEHFNEIAKNIIDIPEINGWERTPFNHRNIGYCKYENFSPLMFCIKNGNKNVGILPSRYFYSKPIQPRKYNRFKNTVQKYIEEIPHSKSIRGGAF